MMPHREGGGGGHEDQERDLKVTKTPGCASMETRNTPLPQETGHLLTAGPSSCTPTPPLVPTQYWLKVHHVFPSPSGRDLRLSALAEVPERRRQSSLLQNLLRHGCHHPCWLSFPRLLKPGSLLVFLLPPELLRICFFSQVALTSLLCKSECPQR